MLNSTVPPFVTVHPESKMRMSGQSVTFCCEGEGNPPPEIEWYETKIFGPKREKKRFHSIAILKLEIDEKEQFH